MSESLKTKGAHLEQRVARSEFAAGALVRLRVPVVGPGDAGKRVLTDVDVLSIEFDSRLRETKTVFECKSTRGQRGEPDRLLWLAGFKQLMRADRAVLVRDTASARGVDLARRLQIEILDVPTLRKHEESFAWVPDAFGLVGDTEFVSFETKALDGLKRTGSVSPAYMQYLRHDLLFAPSYRAVGALGTLKNSEGHRSTMPDVSAQYVASFALVGLVLAGLRAAQLLENRSNNQALRLFETALITGNPYDRQVLDVLDTADVIVRHIVDDVHAAYAADGARRLSGKVPSLRSAVADPPTWLPAFVDLAERLRSRPQIARELPQTLDLACFDAAVGGAAWQAPAFDRLFTIEHRQLIIVLIRVLHEVVGDIASAVSDRILELRFDRRPGVAPDRLEPYPSQKGKGQPRPTPLDALPFERDADPETTH